MARRCIGNDKHAKKKKNNSPAPNPRFRVNEGASSGCLKRMEISWTFSTHAPKPCFAAGFALLGNSNFLGTKGIKSPKGSPRP